MKKPFFLIVLAFAALLLTGCGRKEASTTAIQASVLSGEHYVIEVQAVEIEPGGDAVFYIQPDLGYQVTATDYVGEYSLTQAHGRTELTLRNVQYPTRVRLTLSRYACQISYKANGGVDITSAGLTVTRSYDVTDHIRPNVSIGTDLFSRDGYTLTSWNTAPDGSGQRVGLGSRVTVEGSVTLYAQWAKWTAGDSFVYQITDGCAEITGYTGDVETLVIPARLGGCPVTGIAVFAFAGCNAEKIILPETIVRIEKNAFDGAVLRELSFFDNIEYITDDCFTNCENFATLRISAMEDPYGYSYRRESVWADKLDLLITTMGERRILFYGGCSMWYNLIGTDAAAWAAGRYTVLNMGLNGMANSLLQMEILRQFMTENDILFHTPEISSPQQLLTSLSMGNNDNKLWCALEYNYDLVSLVDVRLFDGGVLESLRMYLDKKKPGGSYLDHYRDSKGYDYLDETGSIPYVRTQSADSLQDKVSLDPTYLSDLSRLAQEYGYFNEMGIPIYVSYACVNMDQVPEDQRGNVDLMGELYKERFSAMEGVTLISDIHDFLYHDADCYDTVYHLLTAPAKACTSIWLRDLQAALLRDGRWEQ